MNLKNNKLKLPLILLALALFFFSDYSSAIAICGDKIKDSGEECDFDPEIGPYPGHCPDNGACDWETCKCEVCVPSCTCATNLCSNSNCSNGCGSTCVGQKACTDGECGSADGKGASIMPTTNLCSKGAVSAYTGSGPWSWTCQGIDGGKDTSCHTIAGESAEEYVSLHRWPGYASEKYYCSEKPTIDGVAGVKDEYPCNGDEKGNIYKYTYLTEAGKYGIKYFNPHDPKITCQNDDEGCTWDDQKLMNIYNSWYFDDAEYKEHKRYLDPPAMMGDLDHYVWNDILKFKVYIPPGTQMFSVGTTAAGGNRSKCVIPGPDGFPINDPSTQAVVRFGAPPEAELPATIEEFRVLCENQGDDCYKELDLCSLKEQDVFQISSGSDDDISWSTSGRNASCAKNNSGWLYVKMKNYTYPDVVIDGKTYQCRIDFVAMRTSNPYIPYDTYTTWYDCMNEKNGWDANGDPKEGFTACDPSAIPSGPDCDEGTCKGNSCWNDTKYIPGIRTEDCATGEAKADPDRLTNVGKSFITWSSQDASEVDVACNGSFPVPRGTWYRSGEECYEDGQYCELNETEKGIKLTFDEKFFQADQKQETCTFYPTNESDGQPGTPFSFTINFGEEDVDDDSGIEKTCENFPGPSFCPGGIDDIIVTGTDANGCSEYDCVSKQVQEQVCNPDNPSCDEQTCRDLYCFDGCDYLKGKLDCVGKR